MSLMEIYVTVLACLWFMGAGFKLGTYAETAAETTHGAQLAVSFLQKIIYLPILGRALGWW